MLKTDCHIHFSSLVLYINPSVLWVTNAQVQVCLSCEMIFALCLIHCSKMSLFHYVSYLSQLDPFPCWVKGNHFFDLTTVDSYFVVSSVNLMQSSLLHQNRNLHHSVKTKLIWSHLCFQGLKKMQQSRKDMSSYFQYLDVEVHFCTSIECLKTPDELNRQYY